MHDPETDKRGITSQLAFLPCLPLWLMLLTLLSPGVIAQQSSTLFWMQGVPQSNNSNPAFMPLPGYYVGMPAMSSLYLNASSRGFATGDFISRNALDEILWDEDALVESLLDNNLLLADASMEWFSFGFRTGPNLFTFQAVEKLSLAMAYPRDLGRLVLKGTQDFPGEQGAGNFEGFSMNHMHYREFSMGYAREISPFFTVGVRGRVLFGLRNQWTEKAAFALLPDPAAEGLMLHPDVRLNHSSGKSLGMLEQAPFRFPDRYGVSDFRTRLDNAGGAVDVGLMIYPTEKISLAFSLLDLGFIRWRNGVENYLISGSSVFDGIDAEEFFNRYFISNMEAFIDGVPDHFDVSMTSKGYMTRLSPRILGGAGLALSDRHQLAMLSSNLLYEGKLYSSFSFSYNVKPSRATGLSLAWSAAHMNYYNIGLGMHANLGPFQFYVVGDNLLGFILPNKVQWNSLQAGINWVFNYRPKQTEVPEYGL